MSDEDMERFITGFPLYGYGVLLTYEFSTLRESSEYMLDIIKRLVLAAEDRAEKRMAGVLLGMKPQARDEFIRRKAE